MSSPFNKTGYNDEAPMHVHSVRVLGTDTTRKSFLDTLTAGLFRPHTTGQVFAETKDLATQLDKHDIFEEIKVYLDTNQQTKDAVDVTLLLKEKPRGLIKTALVAGNNEAQFIGSAVSRNLFGGAESIGTSFAFGNRTKYALEGVFSTPLNGSPHVTASAFVHRSVKDHSAINFYEQATQSAGLGIKTESHYGEHQLSYVVSHRDITGYANASSTVRGQSGANDKVSLYHSFVHDTRDHKTLATEGHYLGLFQEWAGVGGKGEASFFKHELAGQCHHTLVNKPCSKVSLSIGGQAGLLTAFNDNEINLSDRLYLGGPLSIRGFKMGGIGARNGNDALGGNMYWSLGASLISTLPGHSADLPIKMHAFANAGNMSDWKRGEPVNNTLQDLARDPRVSVGLGLIFHFDAARVETNFTVPLRFRTGDVIDSGFNFGIGINFL